MKTWQDVIDSEAVILLLARLWINDVMEEMKQEEAKKHVS